MTPRHRLQFATLLFVAACSSNPPSTSGPSAPSSSSGGSSSGGSPGSSGATSSSGGGATSSSGGGSGGASSGGGSSSGASSGSTGSSGSSSGSGGTGSSSGGGASADGGSGSSGAGPSDAGSARDATTGSTGNPGGDDGGPPTDAAARAVCTGTSPIACHFGGNPGNYAVTVVLGGAVAAETEVQAETSREMLGYVSTAAGQTQRFSFLVNVRQPEGQPVEAVPPGTPGLDLYFYGSNGSVGEDAAPGGNIDPQLAAIGFAPIANPLVIYVAGDSTVCDQSDTNYAGWAQFLPSYFGDGLSIANYADSGESSVSFLANAQLWGGITSRWKAGDWVLIQFGHNDKTTTTQAFHDNITTMVTQAKTKGVHPLLFTPPARATFSGQTLGPQFIYTTPLDVVAVMKQVATEQSVPLVDLTAITTTWYNQLGPNGWQAFHALGTDQTHTNREGASAIAGFVAKALRDQNIGLAPYLR